jgi:hypothetical protein
MNILQQSTYVLVYNPSKQNAIDEWHIRRHE